MSTTAVPTNNELDLDETVDSAIPRPHVALDVAVQFHESLCRERSAAAGKCCRRVARVGAEMGGRRRLYIGHADTAYGVAELVPHDLAERAGLDLDPVDAGGWSANVDPLNKPMKGCIADVRMRHLVLLCPDR